MIRDRVALDETLAKLLADALIAELRAEDARTKEETVRVARANGPEQSRARGARDPPPPPLSETAAALLYQRAWNRLPRPPFAAAAAADCQNATRAFTHERFGALVEALGKSKWLNGTS